MLVGKKKRNVLWAAVMTILLLLAPTAGVLGAGSAPDKLVNDELVITTLDDQGQIADIQVLNHLRFFGSGSYTIENSSRYKLASIRNLYSSEKVIQKDGSLQINASVPSGQAFGDIYYLSALAKEEIAKVEFPVDIQIEYYLDGQKTTPSQMAGKSGHMKIMVYLENKTASMATLEFTDADGNIVQQESEVYTPYVVSLSGWEFANKKFVNISAPGVEEESPAGVPVTIKDITSVSWTVPLVPPKYPAKQYIVLEADGKDIEMPSFNIAVIPILPTTSEIDSLGAVSNSLAQLYDGFGTIQEGVGDKDKNDTLLFGLNAVKDGVTQISGGLGTLLDNMKILRKGLSNSAFDAGTYNSATGADAQGAEPGLKEAVGMLKSGVEERALPAYGFQKVILGTLRQSIGAAGAAIEEPSDTSSIYNDLEFLKNMLDAEQQKIIIGNIEPKINRLSGNLQAFAEGGNITTGTGSMPFPASVSALEQGSEETLDALTKIDNGLGMMMVGIGMLDRNDNPLRVMVNGNPGSIMYALDYMKSGIDSEMLPGINQILDGTGQIGSGAGEAKEALYAGMQALQSAPAIVSALAENVAQADTFLGKPEGSIKTLAYIFQTPAASKQSSYLLYGLGMIVVVFIILIALGRPPKQAFETTSEHA